MSTAIIPQNETKVTSITFEQALAILEQTYAVMSDEGLFCHQPTPHNPNRIKLSQHGWIHKIYERDQITHLEIEDTTLSITTTDQQTDHWTLLTSVDAHSLLAK